MAEESSEDGPLKSRPPGDETIWANNAIRVGRVNGVLVYLLAASKILWHRSF